MSNNFQGKIGKIRQWCIALLITFAIVHSSTNIVLGLLLKDSQPSISCLLQSSTWKYGTCRYKTSDAGTPCNSSTQCQSWCVAEKYFPLGTEAVGVCYDWTRPKSCLDFVDYGVLAARTCYD